MKNNCRPCSARSPSVVHSWNSNCWTSSRCSWNWTPPKSAAAPNSIKPLPRQPDPTGTAMSLPQKVNIVEVGPRDGLQNEALPISIEDKVRLVDDLSAAGLGHIEAGSFVSSRWVPQMAGSAQVLAQIQRRE
ncbi:Hydroxymethylglutaryl-CoA lyase, partial [Pseudomonas cannabina]